MKKDYTKIIPLKYHNVSYEIDVNEEIKIDFAKQFLKGEGLYIWGEPGSGKTYVACAIAKMLIDKYQDVMFFNTGDLLEQIREEYNKSFEGDEVGIFRKVMDFKGVLILDDIGAEKATEWVRERLYLIINKRWDEVLTTIFTSNCNMEDLSGKLTDRVASRIVGMTVRIKLESADKRLTN